MKVRFTKPALAELDAFFAYIHQHNLVAAGHVVARVREITSQFGRFPDMGHPKYKPGVRMITVRRYPYLIFYTVEKNEVLILSARHGARQPFDEE
jgi:plasmid stabilization system protein ParE